MEKNFENDLEYGRIGEIKFINKLIQKNENYKCELNIIKDKEKKDKLTPEELQQLRGWDVKLTTPTSNFLFEVKRDQKSKYTGNICIEKICVTNSKSDFFVYILDDDCEEMYIITKKNINYLLSNEIHGFFTYGGDGNRSYMKIVQKQIFFKYSTKVNW